MIIVCSGHGSARLDYQSRAASSQQQMAKGPRPGVASSATGRQPLADDRSSRRWTVKEETRGTKGWARGRYLSQKRARRHYLASRGRFDVIVGDEGKQPHTGATASERCADVASPRGLG